MQADVEFVLGCAAVLVDYHPESEVAEPGSEIAVHVHSSRV